MKAYHKNNFENVEKAIEATGTVTFWVQRLKWNLRPVDNI